MNLNKKATIIASLFIMYSLMLFILAGFDNGLNFWIAYIFIIIAFIIVGISMKLTDKKLVAIERFFLNYSFLTWSAVYLIIQMLLSTLYMIFSKIDVRILVVSSILILFMYIVLVVGCYYQKSHIVDIENKSIAETRTIKNFRVDISIYVHYAKDLNIKKDIEKLSEEFKYSDPVSHKNLESIELLIQNKVDNLKGLLIGNEKYEIVKANIDEISDLLKERNIKCKANK